MALRQILTIGDETLNKKSKPVTAFNERLWELLDDMAETMYSANGVGLAAIQIGIFRRVVVIDTGDGLIELINPEIIEQSGSQSGLEGCLSVPGKWGEVTRPMKVKVKAQDRNGKPFEFEGEDFTARALCHEIDHLDGHLYTEIAETLMDRTNEE